MPSPPAGESPTRTVLLKARNEGWRGCIGDLRTAHISAGITQAALRAALDPPVWFERVESHVNVKSRWERMEKSTLGLGAEAGRFPRPLSREDALAILFRTMCFTDTIVGIGARPPEVPAFCRILEEPDAKTVFAELLERGQTPGKLFALTGLYLTDRPAYDLHLPDFQDSEETIVFFSGCSRNFVSVKQIVVGQDYKRWDSDYIPVDEREKGIARWAKRFSALKGEPELPP